MTQKVIDGVVITAAAPSHVIKDNIKYNSHWTDMGAMHHIYNMPEWRKTTQIAIVGGGASLENTWPLLKDFKYIIACGSVHDYLISKGIVPTYCVVCDPDPLVINYLQSAFYRCKYLIASQCDKSVLGFLQGKFCKVYMWHAGRDSGNEEYFRQTDMLVGGGCTVGTRAISIAFNFGYEDMHLFGFDTCVQENNKSHAYEFSTDNEKITKILDISVGDVKFKMAEYMLGQLFDFQEILRSIGDRVRFTVHGEGALKTLLDIGKTRITENGR